MDFCYFLPFTRTVEDAGPYKIEFFKISSAGEYPPASKNLINLAGADIIRPSVADTRKAE